MSLTLYPAIDLRGGRAVRLVQGDFARETVYGEDPLAVAEQFERAGATWVHVVDLDGAKDGEAAHAEMIGAIASKTGLQVELGGGLRTDADVARALDWGVARIVLGTAAAERPDWVATLATTYPGRIAVGMDVKGGRVATRGWLESSRWDVDAFIERFNEAGIAALIFTQIARDGAMRGPDIEALRAVLEKAQVPVVASGGVHQLEDLRALANLRSAGPLDGVIVGRALYEGAFDVADALAALQEEA